MGDRPEYPLKHPRAAAAAKPRVLLYGAAGAIAELARSIAAGHHDVEVCGSLPLERSDDLKQALKRHQPDRVLVCLPLMMVDAIDAAVSRLDHLGVRWSYVPPLADQLAGRIMPPGRKRGATPVRLPGAVQVDPVTLIGRRPHALDSKAIARTLTDRVVLISGAGGSIGSELAHIAARFNPRKLVLAERSENALFEIDRLLARLYPDVERAAVLHDVTNASRTEALVIAQKPHVIFHAAAHKHVPMMEEHPADAIENNFYGTRHLANAAARQGVERFVMISTDKAVNPSSVMGASKRLAELYIQSLNQRSDTQFAMVRFGNVLGSACSVLPIWSQQIAAGHPVTVTDRNMTRYFMTIPEAAGLVIQSAAYAEGGEVFLLDMGEPVRIVDLAERFIRSQGLTPHVDVQIEYTGIRPGEKLFEELAYGGEDMAPTPHPSIRIWQTTPPTRGRMAGIVETFDRLRAGEHPWLDVKREQIHDALRAAIPEMVEPAGAARSLAG